MISILGLSDAEASEIHRGNTTKLAYRLAWARNYLKRYGLLENSSRGVWALTQEGFKATSVDKEQVKRKVVAEDKQQRSLKNRKANETIEEIGENEEVLKLNWQDQLLEALQQMLPSGFERLCQRLLRELGFQNVEVTGRANDGGIDRKGILRLGGVLSFHVIFQAK